MSDINKLQLLAALSKYKAYGVTMDNGKSTSILKVKCMDRLGRRKTARCVLYYN
jgi:hypothetical protein